MIAHSHVGIAIGGVGPYKQALIIVRPRHGCDNTGVEVWLIVRFEGYRLRIAYGCHCNSDCRKKKRRGYPAHSRHKKGDACHGSQNRGIHRIIRHEATGRYPGHECHRGKQKRHRRQQWLRSVQKRRVLGYAMPERGSLRVSAYRVHNHEEAAYTDKNPEKHCQQQRTHTHFFHHAE